MGEEGDPIGARVDQRVRGPRFMRMRTVDAPARDRFDYWRSLFPAVDMHPARRTDVQPYDSENLYCAGDDGVIFAGIRSDATDTRFKDGEESYVIFSFITQGAISVRHGQDRLDMTHRRWD